MLCFVCGIWILLRPQFSFASPKERERLEDLFIWKVCNELDLPLEQEKKLTQVLKNLGEKKDNLKIKLQNLGEELKTKPQKLSDYKKALAEFSKIPSEEIQKVEEILGPKLTPKYIILKLELNERVKSLVLTPEPNPPTQKNK